jgi:hypothetical protein
MMNGKELLDLRGRLAKAIWEYGRPVSTPGFINSLDQDIIIWLAGEEMNRQINRIGRIRSTREENTEGVTTTMMQEGHKG